MTKCLKCKKNEALNNSNYCSDCQPLEEEMIRNARRIEVKRNRETKDDDDR